MRIAFSKTAPLSPWFAMAIIMTVSDYCEHTRMGDMRTKVVRSCIACKDGMGLKYMSSDACIHWQWMNGWDECRKQVVKNAMRSSLHSCEYACIAQLRTCAASRKNVLATFYVWDTFSLA